MENAPQTILIGKAPGHDRIILEAINIAVSEHPETFEKVQNRLQELQVSQIILNISSFKP